MSKARKDAKGVSSPADVYQKFLDFLKSPMWSMPVMSFVEQRSVVFDNEQGDESLYEKIFNEFRNMVDMLIQCFCDDLGVKPEMVAEAVKGRKSDKQKSNVDWSLLEPVIAANDQKLFVHMMIRKNIELQLQAVHMIEIMCGLIPAILLPSAQPETEGTLKNAEDQEKIILLQVIRQSKDEFERQKARNELKTKELETAIKESLMEKDRLEKERDQEQELTDQTLKLSLTEPSESRPSTDVKSTDETVVLRKKGVNELPAVKAPVSKRMNEETKEQRLSASAEAIQQPSAPSVTAKTPIQVNNEPNVEALRKRQEYLRQQRDKLLAMKREAREQAFSEAESDGKQTRPKTARMAKAALRGGLKGDLPPVSNDVLAARRALAEKLKQEVVGDL